MAEPLIVSLGCRLNIAESETIRALNGGRDMVVVNSCAVTNGAVRETRAAIVNAIARLGDSLNLPITAEGIEDGAIEERLRTLGCSKGQGYFYGRPMSISNTRRLLAEKRLLREADGEKSERKITAGKRLAS